MEKQKYNFSADMYNLCHITSYVILIGIPLRIAFEADSNSTSLATCVLAFLITGAVLSLMEFLIFRKWRKKLVMVSMITHGNMYARTYGGYKSANDIATDRKEELEKAQMGNKDNNAK